MTNVKLSDLILLGEPYRIRVDKTDFEYLDLSDAEIVGMVETANGSDEETMEYADKIYINIVDKIGYDPELIYAPPALCKQFQMSCNSTTFEIISHMHFCGITRELIASAFKEHGL